MATIRIDDLPTPRGRTQEGHSTGIANGIYPIRSRSLTTRSVERRGGNHDDYGDETAGLRQDGDFKQKQVR